MNIKTSFCSASQDSFTVISAFPGRRSQQDPAGCWQHLKVKPLLVSTASSLCQGMGPGTSIPPLFPCCGTVLKYWVSTWFFSVILSTCDIETFDTCIQKFSLQPSCSGWNWIDPPRVLLGLFPIFIPRLLWNCQDCTRWRNEPGSHLPFTRYQEIWTENTSMT